MIKTTVLLENTLYNKNLKKAHGLSLLIKTPETQVLLDTGPNSKFSSNAKKLGIDLSFLICMDRVLEKGEADETGPSDCGQK